MSEPEPEFQFKNGRTFKCDLGHLNTVNTWPAFCNECLLKTCPGCMGKGLTQRIGGGGWDDIKPHNHQGRKFRLKMKDEITFD